MKKLIFPAVVVLLIAALLTGCAGTYYDDGYRGNVSTSDDGYVNGTNDWLDGSYSTESETEKTHRSSGTYGSGSNSPYTNYGTNGSYRNNENGSGTNRSGNVSRSYGSASGRSVPSATVPSQSRNSAAQSAQ